MGPKKDKAKAADPKGAEGGDPGENPQLLIGNYTKFCKCGHAHLSRLDDGALSAAVRAIASF